MSEAVIVSAARTPIGRAKKGSLLDVRPDGIASITCFMNQAIAARFDLRG